MSDDLEKRLSTVRAKLAMMGLVVNELAHGLGYLVFHDARHCRDVIELEALLADVSVRGSWR